MTFHPGHRVRAVHMKLDEGLRIWPVPGTQLWRVVSVRGNDITSISERAGFAELQAKFPDAVPGLNDNETVPPGTLGTVKRVSALQTTVCWDNGHTLNHSPEDVIASQPSPPSE